MKSGNLFRDIPDHLPEEQLEMLSAGKGYHIERIISRGHASPADFWYDLDAVEWVVLLSGTAVLRFEEVEKQVVEMHAGDWIEIPAHCRHRVESTSEDEDCVWLAVHGE